LNHAELTSQFLQRAASSSSGAESSQWATTATASAASAFAVGSAAWYYYQFGRDAHAMTPAEEGYVAHRLHTHDHPALTIGPTVFTPPSTLGSTRSSTRPSTTSLSVEVSRSTRRFALLATR
jgi:hypothetical protein